MPDRRQMLACLSLGWTGALAASHRGCAGAATEESVPGAGAGPGWRHQTLPKLGRANDFKIVPDDSRRVLRVRSSSPRPGWPASTEVARRPA